MYKAMCEPCLLSGESNLAALGCYMLGTRLCISHVCHSIRYETTKLSTSSTCHNYHLQLLCWYSCLKQCPQTVRCKLEIRKRLWIEGIIHVPVMMVTDMYFLLLSSLERLHSSFLAGDQYQKDSAMLRWRISETRKPNRWEKRAAKQKNNSSYEKHQ